MKVNVKEMLGCGLCVLGAGGELVLSVGHGMSSFGGLRRYPKEEDKAKAQCLK